WSQPRPGAKRTAAAHAFLEPTALGIDGPWKVAKNPRPIPRIASRGPRRVSSRMTSRSRLLPQRAVLARPRRAAPTRPPTLLAKGHRYLAVPRTADCRRGRPA